MKKMFILLWVLMLFVTVIYADEIPDNIVYHPAPLDLNQKIKEKLGRIVRGKLSLEGLPDNWDNKENVIIVGKNLGDRILQNQSMDPYKAFYPIPRHAPLKMAESIKFIDYGINNPEQLKVFSEYFWKGVELDSDFKIRELTAEEMVLIWFFIGWDLDGPIFVVEDSDNKIVFDFTANGEQLDWIEDINAMEFEVSVNGETIKANPKVVGEGKSRGVFFFGSGKEDYYVIE